MKIKLITAAVVLAAAGNASAAIVSPFENYGGGGGQSEAVFTIWDPTTNQSYSQDLGTTWETFHDNLGNASFSASYVVDTAIYDLALGGSDTSNLVWNVSVADAILGNYSNFGDVGVIGTSNSGNLLNSAAIGAAMQTHHFYASVLNGLGSADPAVNDAYFGTVDNGAYAGNPQTWGTRWNISASIDNSAAFGTDLDFYYWQDVGINTDGAVTKAAGSWSFDGTTLSYGAPSAVPIPAAAWLFGSGLLGLVGVARRKHVAA